MLCKIAAVFRRVIGQPQISRRAPDFSPGRAGKNWLAYPPDANRRLAGVAAPGLLVTHLEGVDGGLTTAVEPGCDERALRAERHG